jgi:thiol-disulfide isomerase/thioredoxin
VRTLGLVAILALANSAYAADTSVSVSFVEALSPKDTTSSERFRSEYQNAVRLGIQYTSATLTKCGYSIQPEFHFFDASDEVQAFEKGKAANANGKWLIVGPRRSQQFLVLTKGAGNTPSVSTMASSTEVFALAPQHLTMAPSNESMAKVAVVSALSKIKSKPKTFFTVVNSDCVTCRDFAKHFEAFAAKKGLKNPGSKEVIGDDPELGSLPIDLARLKPSIVLLPNYSKPSAQIMKKLQTLKPQPLYVGGDGWGDSNFGFVEVGNTPDQAQGITVRGFPPAESGLKTFSIGNQIAKDKSKIEQFPASGSAQALIKIVADLSELLCAKKPKSKEDFTSAFLKSPHFKPTWGVSVYKLVGGNITFESIQKVPR